MWADQANNYDNFVKWVKEYDPDVCVWCEAQTIYENDTNISCAKEKRYLTDNWSKLAARYGHDYWTKSGHRDNYPQVITSKYPIEKVLDIVGSEPDSVVTHGACLAKISVGDKTINIVTLHTWPQSFAYKATDREASKTKREGDFYRRMEVEYICKHTILTEPDAANQFWMMLGDFNSKSPKDNYVYNHPECDSRLITQEYILSNTPYIDVIGDRTPRIFHSTTAGKSRIDYIYCTAPLYNSILNAYVVKDEYTGQLIFDKTTRFHRPSDHRPILVDFDINSLK